MEKFYLKNGEEVKMGDVITLSCLKGKTAFGRVTLVKEVLVNEESLPNLIKMGVVFKKEVKAPIHMDLDYYMNKVAARLGENVETIYKYFNLLDTHYPSAPISILMKEIALELDKKYTGHIKDSDEIWVVSTTNGQVGRINKDQIKSYRYFSAFRSKEDAMMASTILRSVLTGIADE